MTIYGEGRGSLHTREVAGSIPAASIHSQPHGEPAWLREPIPAGRVRNARAVPRCVPGRVV